MLNRVVLVGRLTKDPEIQNHSLRCECSDIHSCSKSYVHECSREREADFINCVVFRRQADNVNNYLSKGSLAGVDGRLQSRNYENQEGRRVFVTEVVCDSVQFLEPKNAQQNGGQRQQNEFQDYGQGFGGQQSGQNNSYNNSSNTKQSDNPFANANGPIDISDDDLPF
ncbi:single-stranded DNA-binding protein [Staphylococcus aureus]|nr:single-stranded DNA-binding protein [Staphylococcus aureus]